MRLFFWSSLYLEARAGILKKSLVTNGLISIKVAIVLKIAHCNLLRSCYMYYVWVIRWTKQQKLDNLTCHRNDSACTQLGKITSTGKFFKIFRFKTAYLEIFHLFSYYNNSSLDLSQLLFQKWFSLILQ